jgi:hypothetical protein
MACAVALDSPVVGHGHPTGHHAGKWLSTGHEYTGLQCLQSPLAVLVLSCCFGWKVWEARLGHRKRIGNWLAVHTRVHPRCIRSGVTVDG